MVALFVFPHLFFTVPKKDMSNVCRYCHRAYYLRNTFFPVEDWIIRFYDGSWTCWICYHEIDLQWW